ncbi:MAG TPA: right-handed parallel beta-helix repeat-containing protein [Puia sp.]|nr:right-handed parallel beta-helix repeat-containing protein [Puia sp.]
MEQPFARPEDAWNAIVALKKPVNATIYLRAGTYSFSNSLTLSALADTGSQVSFAAYQNEKVEFSGGLTLDNKRFTVTTNPQILNRLPRAARGKVVEIDLRQAGVTDFGKKVSHGYKTVRNAPLELFYNDSALPVARYPNKGYLPIGQVLDHGSNPRNGEKPDRGAKFICDDAHLKNWGQTTGAWVAGYFSYGYSDDYLPVASIDVSSRTIQLKEPSLYTVFSTDDKSNDMLKNSGSIRGYYVYDLPEELDSPGEWWLDTGSGKLYCWLPGNSAGGADIEVSTLEQPIVAMNGARNITLKGIHFVCSRGSGIVLKNTSHVRIENCAIGNVGVYGIYAGGEGDNYNRGLMVSSCSIFNTGTGGVMLDGGDRKTLTPGNNVVDNCDIYNFSRINRTYSFAVAINGVGNMVTHCDIHDAPDQAISFYGNDHVIAYNHFKDLVTYMTDAGAVGTGRDIGSTGNSIDNNYFENIESEVGTSVCAIYLDDGSSGMDVNGNIFYRCGTAGSYHFGAIHVHGGSDNVFMNNQFIECHQAFSISPITDDQWKSIVSDPNIEKSYRAGVDLHSAPYAKYKHLARLMAPGAAPARINNITNTKTYKVDVITAGGGNGVIEKNTENESRKPAPPDGIGRRK